MRLFRDPLKGSTVCLCRGTRPPQLSHRVADRRKQRTCPHVMLELRLCERFKLNSAILDAEASSAYLALKMLSAASRRNGIRVKKSISADKVAPYIKPEAEKLWQYYAADIWR